MATKHGRWLETLVEQIANHYQRTGRARLEKVEAPTKIFGRKVIHLQNPFLDFTGSWRERGGQSVHIECKATQKPRLAVNRAGGLTPGQFEAMLDWEEAGAACFLIWGHANRIKMVSCEQLRRVDGSAAASMKWEEAWDLLPGSGILSVGDPLLTFDWWRSN